MVKLSNLLITITIKITIIKNNKIIIITTTTTTITITIFVEAVIRFIISSTTIKSIKYLKIKWIF